MGLLGMLKKRTPSMNVTQKKTRISRAYCIKMIKNSVSNDEINSAKRFAVLAGYGSDRFINGLVDLKLAINGGL